MVERIDFGKSGGWAFVGAIIGGVLFLVVALNAQSWVHGELTVDIVPVSLIGAPWDEQLLFGSMYPGLFLVGAVGTYLYLRLGLVTPAVIVLGPFSIVLWFESRHSTARADLITPYDLYLVGWVAVLVTVVVVAAGEWWIRHVAASSRLSGG